MLAALARRDHSLYCSLLKIDAQSGRRLVSGKGAQSLIGRARIGSFGQSAVTARVESDVLAKTGVRASFSDTTLRKDHRVWMRWAALP